MSLFQLGKTTCHYGVVVDIGSGSVLAAIVKSAPEEKYPHIVWSYRQHASLSNIDSLEKSAKAVMAALVTVLMKLDAEGRKVLYDHDKKAKLTDMQCTISAPWSYTVTKTISYKQESEFIVTKGLIDELTTTIQEKVQADLKENEVLQELGLSTITRATLGMMSNGYSVKHPEGQKASKLAISHTTVVTHKYLVDAIDEMHEKLFVQSELKKVSFILLLFCITRELLSKKHDVCLVDITYEATEIGVIRDGILKYSTHTPFGSFSLAREISSITGAPLIEAFGYLHTEKPYSFTKTLTESKKKAIDTIFEAYIDRVASLFRETGDSLSIPRRISLHADLNSEMLFLDLIEKAAKRSTKVAPNITLISNELINQTHDLTKNNTKDISSTDTALLLSAQFFHIQSKHQTFDYL
ncbi:MAG: hypothetical protein ACI9BF_000048 [Candidatus Paceibacteria bacterium]|jgi:hypothetical protein